MPAMLMNYWRKKLLELVREKVKKDRTGHDYFHLLRTEKYALWIAKHENNVESS